MKYILIILTILTLLFADSTDVDISKKYLFDSVSVHGYLDEPTAIFILDADENGKTYHFLNKSFLEALKYKVDKETIKLLCED